MSRIDLRWREVRCLCGVVLAGVLTVAAAAQSAAPQKQIVVQAPTPQADAVEAPTAQPAQVTFPPVLAKNFTAATPTVDTVNAFLKSLWGYDDNREWSVQAILATPAPGVVKVDVLISDKRSPGKVLRTVFYVTPDGHHAIADQVINFGAKPFEATRLLLQAKATGPAEGAASKDLEFVEFGDLQCPHCKDAAVTMTNLQKEFPQARIVWEDFPITQVHPYAFRAAAEGVCLRQAKGDAAFFTYQAAVYDKQADLTAAKVDATLAAAITAAGGDPKDAAACAQTDLAKDAIAASTALGKQAEVSSTPTLFVNGRSVPLVGVSLETLKQIIAFQASQDGITVHLQPTLSDLK